MIKADDTGYFSLTDMWKANGRNQNRKPQKWFRHDKTVNLLNELKKDTKGISNPLELYKTVKGGKMPGTWGLQKVAIAYAEYLSPEFHASGPAVPGY